MKVIIPLPHEDFDPTEVAVSWRILKQGDCDVVFATPGGSRAYADPLMLSGEGLDVWGRVPGLQKLKLLGLTLRANAAARRDYAAMERDPAFLNPHRYDRLLTADFDGLLIPGGHCARGMRPYLESDLLQRFVAEFFDSGKPVAAVCHGVVLVARSKSLKTGKSVLYGRKTTALTWKLENTAWSLMRYAGRVWDPDYYRTYLDRSVQSEVTSCLEHEQDFQDAARFRQSSGLFRDSDRDSSPAFVVRDGNYVSARWPGDVHTFARTFLATLLPRA